MNAVPPKTVIAAAVHDLRTELGMIKPEFKRVGLMACDAIEALDERIDSLSRLIGGREEVCLGPVAEEIHQPEPPPLRARKKKGERA